MASHNDTPVHDEEEGGPVKNFLEHLEDFRWVLVKSAVAVSIAMLLCLIGANYVIEVIKWPMTQAHIRYPLADRIAVVNFGTNQLGKFRLSLEEQRFLDVGTNQFVEVEVKPVRIGTNQVLGWQVSSDPAITADAQRMHINLVNLNPAGGFFVAFQVAIYGGMVIAGPIVLFFLMSFIFPALKINEKKHIFRAMIIGSGLFLTGVAFCFFGLMPVALQASQMYSQWLGLGAYEWRAEDYISFVCKFLLGMGLGFELPVVILTLVKIGILDYRTLSKARRYVIVINLILGAVLTTPEPITQIVMFVPLQVLYEITVWIAWYWNRRDKKRAARES